MTATPFSSLRPPRPPAELRGRVLAACRREAVTGEADGLLDLLWRNRWARRGWLATVVILVLANLAALPSPADGRRRQASSTTATAEALEEVGLTSWWWRQEPGTTWADLGPAGNRSDLEID